MMEGSCVSIMKSQAASMSGTIIPIRSHSCFAKSTICCSVVSEVMKLSMSVMMSTQRVQVRSLRGWDRRSTLGEAAAQAKARARITAAFMFASEDVEKIFLVINKMTDPM